MKPFPIDQLRVEYLRESHNISFFSCSNGDLNDFLKMAKKEQAILGYLRRLSRTRLKSS